MFGLGMGEIVLIAIVALLFLGPEKLPSAAKTIGKTIRSFRSQTRELTDSLERDTELGDAVRELRSALHDVPERIHHQPPSTAANEQAGDGPDHHGDADSQHHGDDPHPHLAHDDEHHPVGHPAEADDEEPDESVELADPIGGEPDVPTVRPAQGSVARLYSEPDDDAPTEPPRRPKPAGEGNG